MDTQQFQLKAAQGEKLTNWKNEPSIGNLKADFEAAKPAQQAQITKINHWNDLMKVQGKARPPKVKGRSSVQPKLIKRQAEWRYSALSEPFLSSNKLFKLSPVTFEDAPAAKQNELVLNWQFRTKINRVKFIDEFVRATVDEGTSIIRIGWKRTTVPTPETVPTFEHYDIQDPMVPVPEGYVEMFQQALAMKQENPRIYDEQTDPAIKAAVDFYEESQQVTLASQVGEQQVTVDKVIENRPTVEVKNPANVFIDPSCQGDLDKALFVVESFETNQAELKKEGKRYKNLDKVNWEGATPIVEPDHETKTPQDFNFNDPMRKKVVAYEYWGFYDIQGNGTLVPIVASWIGDTLIRLEENPYPDGKLPYVVVNYLPAKRDLYGEPDAEVLEDNQRISGAVTRAMIDLFGRSANAQHGIAKGMLDSVNRRRWQQGEDYEFNPSIHPTQGIMEHKLPELPQSALVMVQMQNQEAEAMTGVKSFSGGMSGEAYGDVAAGIRGVLDAASKREMAILRRLAKGVTEIGVKIAAMNAEFLSEKEVIRITNSEFIEVKREDLKGNFDLETDISTIEVDNAKAQDMAFMLQTIGPNAGPEISMMIMANIAELKRMPDLAHELRTFKPEPDPVAEQLKQIALQKAQMELQVMQSEIQLNQAKAAQVSAVKDKTDLDYVEQETGTKHARDMDKMTAQSQGNQSLEVTKALLKPRKLTNGAETKPDVPAAVGFNQVSDRLNEEQRRSSLPFAANSMVMPNSVPLS